MTNDELIEMLADALKVIRYEINSNPKMAYTLDFAGRVAENALKELNAQYLDIDSRKVA